MKALFLAGLLAITSALAIGVSKPEKSMGREQSGDMAQLQLHEKSTSPTDLELSGDVAGSQAYSGMYVSYAELLRLPQATFTVTDDANFPGKAELGGIALNELVKTLGLAEKSTLVAAVCDDGYEAHYTADYRAAHHPFLVLTIDGKAPALVKRSGEEGSYGPYLISQPRFVARYRVLGHSEEAQIPNGVIGLRFLNEDQAFGAILPRGEFPAKSPQREGYEIAKENCFRCHNAGTYGGHKAGITWRVLGKIARNRPMYFRSYIRGPQAESDYAEMPGFPEYDAVTLNALTAYFQTVPGSPTHK